MVQVEMKAEKIAEKALEANGVSGTEEEVKEEDEDEVALVDEDVAKEEEKLREERRKKEEQNANAVRATRLKTAEPRRSSPLPLVFAALVFVFPPSEAIE